jgi:hypothetical protein
MKSMRVMMAIVFVAAVAAVVASVVVIKEGNHLARIERKVGSGSIDQVAVQADRDSHNRHFSLPSADSKSRLDGVLLTDGSGFLLGGDMKNAPSGMQFQLWAQTSTGPISLGMLGEDAEDTFAFRLPSGADRLFVTTEVPSGAAVPNSASVVVTGALPR